MKFDTANVNVGVVVALGGLASTTCGQPLVQCYDAQASTTVATGLPSTGILRVRGYSNAGTGNQPGDPILRDVTLVPGSCADPYFSSAATSCTFGVSARVDFGAVAVGRLQGHGHRGRDDRQPHLQRRRAGSGARRPR